MGALSTLEALVFIAKALIQTFLYLTGKIADHEYHSSMEEMKASIQKAKTGELPGRLEGGSEIEDQINQHAGKK